MTLVSQDMQKGKLLATCFHWLWLSGQIKLSWLCHTVSHYMVVSYGSLIASKLSHLRLPLTTFFGSHCHTGILHRVAQVNAVNVCNANIISIYNQVSHRFSNFLIRALKSDLLLSQTIYQYPPIAHWLFPVLATCISQDLEHWWQNLCRERSGHSIGKTHLQSFWHFESSSQLCLL